MNLKNIEEVVSRTRVAVDAAKAKGETMLDFASLYGSWCDINLDNQEKEEMKKRFVQENWTLENKEIEEPQTWSKRVMLCF